MEQEQQTQDTVSPEPNASPKPIAPRGRQRCHARKRDGKQCRLYVQDTTTGLCTRHAALSRENAVAIDDSTNVALDLLDSEIGVLDSTNAINIVLTNVVVMLAQGRLSPRRASVITFALSLMLRSVIVQDRQAANATPQVTWNTHVPAEGALQPEPNAHPDPAPSPDAPPLTAHDAMENYARLRT